MKYYALRHKETKLYYLTNDSILNTLVEELSPYCLYNTNETINFYYLSLEYIRIDELAKRHIPYFQKYYKDKPWDDETYTYHIPSSEFEIVEFELTEILK